MFNWQREDKTLATKILYWLWFVNGGLYRSKQPPKQVKYIWLTLFGITLFFVDVVCGLGYLLTVDTQPTVLDLISVLWLVESLSYVLLYVPLITNYYYHSFHKVIDFLSAEKRGRDGSDTINKSQHENENVSDPENLSNSFIEAMLGDFNLQGCDCNELIEETDSVRSVSNWSIFQAIVLLLFSFLGFIDILFVCDKTEPYRNLQHHIFPIPYVSRLSSIRAYYVSFGVQILLALFAFSVVITQPVFTVMIACEMNNYAAEYCRRMRNFSQIITEYSELQMSNAARHHGLYCADISSEDGETSGIRNASSIFEYKLIAYIQQHQKLVDIIKLLRPYQHFSSSVILVVNFAAQFCNVYIILLTNLEPILKLKQIIGATQVAIYLYINCVMGEQLQKISDGIIYEVYNIPWYYLSPRLRKLVHIFLCQTQQRMEFKSFKVYPVNMAMFPRVMNAVYSYVNILRGVINTGHYSVA